MTILEQMRANALAKLQQATCLAATVDEVARFGACLDDLGVAFEVSQPEHDEFEIRVYVGGVAPEVGFENASAVAEAVKAISPLATMTKSRAKEPVAEPALLRTEATCGSVQVGLPVDGSQAATSEEMVVTAERDPQPIQEPAPKPKEVAAQPKTKRANKLVPWTDVDTATLLAMASDGASDAEIAEKLGRSQKAVNVRLSRLRKMAGESKPRGGARHEVVAANPAKIKTPARIKAEATRKENAARVAGVAPAAPVAAAPVAAPVNALDRDVIAHLDRLGYSGKWTAARDLELVEDLCMGKLADVIAVELEIARGAVLDRWKELNRKIGNTDHQARLVAILRARANA